MALPPPGCETSSLQNRERINLFVKATQCMITCYCSPGDKRVPSPEPGDTPSEPGDAPSASQELMVVFYVEILMRY